MNIEEKGIPEKIDSKMLKDLVTGIIREIQNPAIANVDRSDYMARGGLNDFLEMFPAPPSDSFCPERKKQYADFVTTAQESIKPFLSDSTQTWYPHDSDLEITPTPPELSYPWCLLRDWLAMYVAALKATMNIRNTVMSNPLSVSSMPYPTLPRSLDIKLTREGGGWERLEELNCGIMWKLTEQACERYLVREPGKTVDRMLGNISWIGGVPNSMLFNVMLFYWLYHSQGVPCSLIKKMQRCCCCPDIGQTLRSAEPLKDKHSYLGLVPFSARATRDNIFDQLFRWVEFEEGDYMNPDLDRLAFGDELMEALSDVRLYGIRAVSKRQPGFFNSDGTLAFGGTKSSEEFQL